ncbi:hypothetical protein F5B20DRAFT_574511 [Whalleya microplaca]|nr:hypothetical protein F5B20DRAFT_574511 [Whalleya microplaca]
MADESYASASTSIPPNMNGRPSSSTTATSTSHAPPGFGLRRAATVAQTSQLRQRSGVNNSFSPTAEHSFADFRRRSSTYSDFSLNDARRDLETSADELFNPGKASSREVKKSPFAYVPLTLALLPAVAGVFFENGSAFFTDLILLSLAAVFLHWSVTQPWDWYQTAQQVRIMKDEIMTESVFETDSDLEPSPSPEASPSTILEDVPEEETEKEKEPEPAVEEEPPSRQRKQWQSRQAAAKLELYLHEMLALVMCFIFPIIGAYLLHAIRGQLTRPSEGLVSNYNLTIFLCAAEVRPVSHLMRMVQNRTLQCQQIVARNPYEKQSVTTEQFQALASRLDDLESRAPSAGTPANPTSPPEASQTKAVEMAVGREMRSTIQPELDALNRAMRRYEKKLSLLAVQTDNRIEYVDYRLNDAIALAAVAAKNSNSQWSLLSWLFEKTAAVVVLPVQTAAAVLTFPFRAVAGLLGLRGGSASSASGKTTRAAARNGKAPTATAQPRHGSSDRVPTRMSSRR